MCINDLICIIEKVSPVFEAFVLKNSWPNAALCTLHYPLVSQGGAVVQRNTFYPLV